MPSADGQLVITYNGEIYNFRELRAELQREGRQFRSQSDTEVLLHLYERDGEGMVHRLRGMFAFALWDGRQRRLLLARDPYGIKPLYYADNGRTVRIASQVKALLAGNISTRVDPTGLVGFLLFGSVPEPFTIRREVRAVPAGSVLWIDDHGPSAPRAYFSIAETFQRASQVAAPAEVTEAQQLVREALLDSVRAHLVADVPVGAYLSAGIDSGALVGLARDVGAASLETITLGFDEFRGLPADETALAAQTAARYETHHTTRRIAHAEFEQEWPRILEVMDQPSVDGVNTYLVSKAAAEAGLKVVISGLGGDELFGGYRSFRDIPRLVRLLRLPARVPGLGAIAQRLSWPALRSQQRVSPKLAGLLLYGGHHTGAYFLKRGLFMPWELDEIVGERIAHEGLANLAPLSLIEERVRPDPGGDFARVATMESSLYLRTQLLRDSDWASMAHSVELRTPLVDVRLLEAVAPVLVAHDGNAGKSWLASAPRRALPEAVLRRRKSGFSVPMVDWLEAQIRRDAPRGWEMPPSAGAHWSRPLALLLVSLISETL